MGEWTTKRDGSSGSVSSSLINCHLILDFVQFCLSIASTYFSRLLSNCNFGRGTNVIFNNIIIILHTTPIVDYNRLHAGVDDYIILILLAH